MKRSRIAPSIAAILSIGALSSCFDLGARECEDRNCAAMTYRVMFYDSAWNVIDTVNADSLRLEVVGGTIEYLGKTAASADCDACPSSFQGSRLSSDRPIRTGAGDTLSAGTNLLDPQIVGKVGEGSPYSLSLYRATRLGRGMHTFSFDGRIDGKKHAATGSVWVPDSLGF
jgi:hypothetical protein